MGIIDAFKNFKTRNKYLKDFYEDGLRGLGHDGEEWNRESYTAILTQYYQNYGANVFAEEVLYQLQLKTNVSTDFIKKDLKHLIKTWIPNNSSKKEITLRPKTTKFIEYLKKNSAIEYHIESDEELDELNFVVSKEGLSVSTSIRITDVGVNLVKYAIANCPDTKKRNKAILLLNKLNLDNLLRYVMDNNGKITGQFVYWAEDYNFDCSILLRLHRIAINEIIENYNIIIAEIGDSKVSQSKPIAKPKPAVPPKPIQQAKPATPKTLNENDLFNCVKAIPIRFDFNYPQMKENRKLNELCNMLLSGDMISQVLDAGNIESLERNLQVKRLRSTNQEDYNRSLENNILFELYKYSNLMSIFKVLEDRKNDKVKVDYQKLWEMIQIECKTRIQNLSVEKKSNPAIHNLLQRYDYDTRKFKMVINDYIDVRENDYILSGMMSSILYIVMNSVFFGEINNQPVLQMIKSYSSKEIMCMLEALIINTATLRLTTYANGGSMFERD